MNQDVVPVPSQYAAVHDVFDETVSLFHLLRALAAQLHGQGAMTAARRGIMRELQRQGPCTVPQMARVRPVSRQHIQTEVNQLEADGLVERIENAAHKRSRLVRLTPQGEACLRTMAQREREFFDAFGLDIHEDTLRATAGTLRSLRAALAGAQMRLSRGEYGGPTCDE